MKLDDSTTDSTTDTDGTTDEAAQEAPVTPPVLDQDRLVQTLAKTRQEAAAYRVAAKKAEEARQAAAAQAELSAQELDQANAALAAARREIDVNAVAAQYGLPPELAERLQGDDREALAKDAERLAAVVGKPKTVGQAGPRRGGLVTVDTDTDESPKSVAQRILAGNAGRFF